MTRASMISGDMTNGEARTLAALASEVPVEQLEGFAIIAFVHRGNHVHDIIVTSNLSGHSEALNGLLALAMNTSSAINNRGEHENAEDSRKTLRFHNYIRTHNLFHRN